MSLVQDMPERVVATKSDNQLPYSQGSVQKRKVSPLPRMKRTEALKNVIVHLSSVMHRDAQGHSRSIRCNHNQRACSAMPNRSRSSTPRPLRCSGR
jgi:hypothetical protein